MKYYDRSIFSKAGVFHKELFHKMVKSSALFVKCQYWTSTEDGAGVQEGRLEGRQVFEG